ncbi:MAG: hypothetical protein WC980_05340 [Candidatus Brocadiia bacterium]
MKRRLLGAGLLAAICLVMPANIRAQETDDDNIHAQAVELRAEISLVNLVNGLNLTEAQLEQLISVNKEAEAVHNSFKEKGKAMSGELLSSLTALKQALIEYGSNIPPEVGKKANEMKEKAEQLKEEFEAALPGLQSKVDAVLTDAQKEVISTFKPCLLPPKNQKNPVRVGQASSNEAAINALRKLRTIPEKVYETKKNDILDRQFARFEEKHGKLTDEEKSKEQERLFGLVDKARAMNDDEFEISKEELANEFKIKDLREELSDRLKIMTEYREKDKPKLGKTGKFFLAPKMCQVLEAKLTALKNFKPMPSKDWNAEQPTNTNTPNKDKK